MNCNKNLLCFVIFTVHRYIKVYNSRGESGFRLSTNLSVVFYNKLLIFEVDM